MPLGLAVIAGGLAAVALLGPFGSALIEYRVTPTLRDQVIGLDAASLLVVVPLALGAAWMVTRGRPLGAAIALGIGAYTSYMAAQYVVGPDYQHLAGDNQRLFPLFLILFVAGWLIAARAWRIVAQRPLPGSHHRALLLGRIVLPVLATVTFARYIPSLADWTRATPTDAGYLAGPTFAWTIALLDLGVFLPVTVLTCAGLVRKADWAGAMLYLITGWFALVGIAVAAMAVVMCADGDPDASAGGAALMAVLGVVCVAVAAYVFRPLLSERDR